MAQQVTGGRLRRTKLSSPGYTRVRRGKGFTYRDSDGVTVRDEEQRGRFTALAIPPAWSDVWIAPFANGHIQATGVDDAGRRQYIYHSTWRQRRDRLKFDRALDLAAALPSARVQVTRALRQTDDTRGRMLSAAFRMLDAGCLRIGSERYAEENGSHGLSTLLCSHVEIHGETVHFSFPAKSGQLWDTEVADKDLAAFIRWRTRRNGGKTLLSWREDGDEIALSPEDINAFVKLRTGEDFTAKDFRTLRGTVTAAASLAVTGPLHGAREQAGAISLAMEESARVLGNTPSIARTSYVDPRVIDRYRAGETIDRTRLASAESEVRTLLGR